MHKKLYICLAATTALGLSACSVGNMTPGLFDTAGEYLDEGGFGNATMHNLLVQNGTIDYVVDLNERFAAAVPATVTFAFNSATLDPAAKSAIRKQAHFIAQFPEVRFRVFGHTDLVGPNAYNKSLGLRRANAVVAELARHGISRSRLEALVSHGETQPLVNTQDRERRNRRTVTEVSGFLHNSKLVIDSAYAEIVHREYIESATAPSDLVDFGDSDTE